MQDEEDIEDPQLELLNKYQVILDKYLKMTEQALYELENPSSSEELFPTNLKTEKSSHLTTHVQDNISDLSPLMTSSNDQVKMNNEEFTDSIPAESKSTADELLWGQTDVELEAGIEMKESTAPIKVEKIYLTEPSTAESTSISRDATLIPQSRSDLNLESPSSQELFRLLRKDHELITTSTTQEDDLISKSVGEESDKKSRDSQDLERKPCAKFGNLLIRKVSSYFSKIFNSDSNENYRNDQIKTMEVVKFTDFKTDIRDTTSPISVSSSNEEDIKNVEDFVDVTEDLENIENVYLENTENVDQTKLMFVPSEDRLLHWDVIEQPSIDFPTSLLSLPNIQDAIEQPSIDLPTSLLSLPNIQNSIKQPSIDLPTSLPPSPNIQDTEEEMYKCPWNVDVKITCNFCKLSFIISLILCLIPYFFRLGLLHIDQTDENYAIVELEKIIFNQDETIRVMSEYFNQDRPLLKVAALIGTNVDKSYTVDIIKRRLRKICANRFSSLHSSFVVLENLKLEHSTDVIHFVKTYQEVHANQHVIIVAVFKIEQTDGSMYSSEFNQTINTMRHSFMKENINAKVIFYNPLSENALENYIMNIAGNIKKTFSQDQIDNIKRHLIEDNTTCKKIYDY